MDGRHILFKKETSITLFRDLIIVLIAWTNLTDKFSGVFNISLSWKYKELEPYIPCYAQIRSWMTELYDVIIENVDNVIEGLQNESTA
jgi:hypothetical protein